MNAAEVLAAIRRAHPQAALVPELVIRDEPVIAGQKDDPAQAWYRRVDALMIEDLVRTAIEIKVSRADAARETWQKARPWWRVCHRFIYVVPAGLIEHPPVFGAGLWWVHPDGRIEVKRRARVSKSPEPLPQLVVQNIALRATACTARPTKEDDQ